MVTIRKVPLVKGEVYHIFNRSIAEYKIFNNKWEYLRMMEIIRYYRGEKRGIRFSKWKEMKEKGFFHENLSNQDKFVDIIAYCLMPTHIHLILKQLKDKGISFFMSQIANSYARYFNIKHKRKGPLWEREFQNVLVTNDEQLLHLTRYIHLNPTSASLVKRPQDWISSSYREFLGEINEPERICDFSNFLDINLTFYRKFVEDRISYQRDLEKIKHLILE